MSLLLQYTCYVLPTTCILLNMIAGVFPGIHGNRISSFAECHMTDTRCLCTESPNLKARLHIYEDISSCETVITSVKDYLILQCSLNSIASGVCFWFVTLLWKNSYGKFHSGLKSDFFRTKHLNHRSKVPVDPPSPIIRIHTQCKKSNLIYERREGV